MEGVAVANRLQVDEISSIIKERIESFEISVDINEVGKVVGVADGITSVYGLNSVMAGEVVEFETGVKGMVLNLEEANVGIVVLGSMAGIVEGMSVKRTGKLLSIPVGDKMLGRVVNPLGEPVDGKGAIEADETRLLETKAPGIMARKSVHEPLQTGIKAIDALVPVGRGQRSLLSETDRQVRPPWQLIPLSIRKGTGLSVSMWLSGRSSQPWLHWLKNWRRQELWSIP
jgi:F-type H+-transporting ATPase subunit alpha